MAIGLKSNINRIQCKSLRAISDKIIVHNMDFGGQWVLVGHGRWTRGVNITDAEGDKTIRCVDPKDCMLVSDEPQRNMAYGDKEGA